MAYSKHFNNFNNVKLLKYKSVLQVKRYPVNYLSGGVIRPCYLIYTGCFNFKWIRVKNVNTFKKIYIELKANIGFVQNNMC